MRFLSLSALFVVVGCQANGISVRNNEPEAAIVRSQDGTTLTEGALVTLSTRTPTTMKILLTCLAACTRVVCP